MVEVVPAILSHTREDLIKKIEQVMPFVNFIQLDIMDGKFVPNKTVGGELVDEILQLPKAKYEYHWMVNNPEKYMEKIKGAAMHLVHIETVESKAHFEQIKKVAKNSGGKVGIAINPPTDLETILPYINEVEEVLVMTVNPGFSGQKYIASCEEKIRKLRKNYPKLNIEVDGGINLETGKRAREAGANILAAASAIFNEPDIQKAIEKLKKG